MEKVFDIHRVGLLLRRYLMERSSADMKLWLSITVMFAFFRNHPGVLIAIILITGVIFAARFPRALHVRSKSIGELMLPATQLEKIVVALFLNIVYYLAMALVCYVIGNIVGSFIYNYFLANTLFASITYPMESLSFGADNGNDIRWALFGPLAIPTLASVSVHLGTIQLPPSSGSMPALGASLGSYIRFLSLAAFVLGQSLYLLGGIWFKRSHFLQAFIAWNIITVGLILLAYYEYKAFVPEESIHSMDIISSMPVWQALIAIGYCFAVLSIWYICYVRFAEKQV